MSIKSYAKSVIGGREVNQDFYLLNDKWHVYAVADGVGGGLDGDIASKLAITELDKAISQGEALKDVFLAIQREITQYSLGKYGDLVVGTTLTALEWKNGIAKILHVGDSRAYLCRGGKVTQMTTDQEMSDPEFSSPVLACYLGMPQDRFSFDILEYEVGTVPGDFFLLCSDGLYKQLAPERMEQLAGQLGSQPELLVEMMCEEASHEPYSDNVTLIYVGVE